MSTFYSWPEKGKFDSWTVLVTIILVISAFIGIGQVPLFWALMRKIDAQQITSLPENGMADLLGQNYLLTLLLIPFIVCLGMLYLAFKFVHKANVLSFFTSRDHLDWKRIVNAVCLWGLILGLMQFILVLTTPELTFRFGGVEFWNLLLIAIFLLPLQTTCEELLFRSYLFKAFSWFKKPLISILLCSLLFAAMHLGNPEVDKIGNMAILFYLWTGLFLGLMTYLDKGLELAIGYHAINNIFAAVVVTNDWQAFQTQALWLDSRAPSFSWEMYLTLFLFQPLMFFIFSKIYKWDLSSLKLKKD